MIVVVVMMMMMMVAVVTRLKKKKCPILSGRKPKPHEIEYVHMGGFKVENGMFVATLGFH